MKYSAILLSVMMFSCLGQNKMSKIKFSHIAFTPKEQKEITFSMEVPNGYNLKMFKAGGEAGQTNEYCYSDSSIIYLSDFGVSPNESNITKGGYASKKFEFSMKQDRIIGDTLVLDGQNENGYWKEIIIGKAIFGYLNVSKEKKNTYDKSLGTLKNK